MSTIVYLVIKDESIEPKYCPFCSKEVSKSPNLEAYSHKITGYTYYCIDCNIQLSILRESPHFYFRDGKW